MRKAKKCWPWKHWWEQKDSKGGRSLDQCCLCGWWRVWGVSTSGVPHQTFMPPESFVSEHDFLTRELIGYRWAG